MAASFLWVAELPVAVAARRRSPSILWKAFSLEVRYTHFCPRKWCRSFKAWMKTSSASTYHLRNSGRCVVVYRIAVDDWGAGFKLHLLLLIVLTKKNYLSDHSLLLKSINYFRLPLILQEYRASYTSTYAWLPVGSIGSMRYLRKGTNAPTLPNENLALPMNSTSSSKGKWSAELKERKPRNS